MNLADLRRFCVKQRSRIRFSLENGMDCVISEQGICQIPALQAPPSFKLDEQLDRISAFVIETASGKDRTSTRTVSRTDLEVLTAGGELPTHVEHED